MQLANNPILVIDDDQDDLDVFQSAFEELEFRNQLITFRSPLQLLEYLKNSEDAPLLIICDYNMPEINGLELRHMLNSDKQIRHRSIPFVLWSTSASNEQVMLAYENMIQGYFIKPTDYTTLNYKIKTIVDYWKISLIPEKD